MQTDSSEEPNAIRTVLPKCQVLVTRTVADHLVTSGITSEAGGSRELNRVPGMWRPLRLLS
jgi:hypothetical protein